MATLTRTIGVLESATIERHPDNDLVWCNALARVVVDGLLGVEWSASRVVIGRIPIGLMSRDAVP
jgi:hypothetical protein